MPFELPPLPYAQDALEPHYTARTLSFHYGKHHKAYVDTLNKLVEGTELEGGSLEEVIASVQGKPDKQAIFNNAAQVWNHSFFWGCMKPGGGGQPGEKLAAELAEHFGGVEQAVEALRTAGATRFGSGWAWLVDDNGQLRVLSTGNAEQPTGPGVTPLLVVDVWEHAYYLDYQNLRPLYLQTFFERLVSWDFVAENLAAVR
jgi:superoxide dismutase, Fe-Mn family